MMMDKGAGSDRIIDKLSEGIVNEHKALLIPKEKKYIFVIEGKSDRLFYTEIIRKFSLNRDKYKFQECGGKQAVLKLLKDKNKNFHAESVSLFFIDRDFDDYTQSLPPEHSSLFITDGYSFENYLVTDDCLSELLSIHCALPREAIQRIIKQYGAAYDKFADFIKPFMKHVIECLINKQNVECFSLEIESRKKEKLIDVSNDLEFKSLSRQEFEKEFKRKSRTENVSATKKIDDLKNSERDKWLHGKYALYFMRLFYKKVQEKYNVKNKKSNDYDLIEFLSPRISVPLNLSDFLNRHIVK